MAVTWALAAILTWRRVLVVAQGLGLTSLLEPKKTINQLPGIGCCPWLWGAILTWLLLLARGLWLLS